MTCKWHCQHECISTTCTKYGLLFSFASNLAVQLVKKSKQSSEARDKQKRIPFYPPGYLHYPTDLLRSRFSRGECLAQLEQELAATWPRAFLQVSIHVSVLRVKCLQS